MKKGKDMNLQVRFTEKKDVGTIVQLVREGFPAGITDRLIYGAHGIGKYIELQLEEKSSETRYIVAEKDGKPAGFVEYRCLPNSLVLNYIVIDSEFRGKGLASPLLKESIRLLDVTSSQIVLDVFDYNTTALRWYEKFGFKPAGTSYWYDLKFGELERKGNEVYTVNFPQACALYRHFGFSVLTLRCGLKYYQVGILGRHWLRITQKELLSNPDVLLFLAQKYPERKCFALLPEKISSEPEQGIEIREVVKSYRMECELNMWK